MTPNDPRKSDPDYIEPAILKERAAVRDMAEIIWTISRADEGTISAMGADIIAQALADAGFGHVASVEAERDAWKRTADQRSTVAALARAEAAEARLARTQETLDSWQMNESRFAVIREIDADIRAALIAPVDRE